MIMITKRHLISISPTKNIALSSAASRTRFPHSRDDFLNGKPQVNALNVIIKRRPCVFSLSSFHDEPTAARGAVSRRAIRSRGCCT
jgi:hypothetical protein